MPSREENKRAGYIDLADIGDAEHENLYPDGATVELDDGSSIALNDVPNYLADAPSKRPPKRPAS